MGTFPAISVVIPTYNRLDRLRRVLAALAHQTSPREDREIVVVSDGSTDGTDAFLAEAARRNEVVFCSQPNQGPAAARNRGVERARADIVLFVDDDVIATPPLLERHLANHQREGPGAVVIGPMLTPPDFELAPWVRWEQDMLYKQYDAMERGEYGATFRQFYTGNASLARDQVLAVGGFDTRFRRAEDVELAYRLHEAGARFTFDPQAVGYHYADRSFRSWLQNAYDYGANDVVFAREHPGNRILEMVSREYGHRHALVRGVTRACLGRRRTAAAARQIFRGAATVAEAVHAPAVARAALSGLYNLNYYEGMAEQLGGAAAFHRLMHNGQAPARKATP